MRAELVREIEISSTNNNYRHLENQIAFYPKLIS